MKNNKIFMIDLCYYTEENIPECGAVVFISTKKDITQISTEELKNNIFIEEQMISNDCEGIGYICEITQKEFEEVYNDDHELINFDI